MARKRQVHVAFILTMPGVGSWNGKWSGEGDLYAIVRSFREDYAEKLVGSYSYRWNDGWAAMVEAKLVAGKECRAIRKQSRGFCGYGWMIESIISHGRILRRQADQGAGCE